MPNNEPVTLGEVARKIDAVVSSVDKLAARVDERPSWQDIKRVEDGWRATVTHAQGRLEDLESWVTWAGRLVLGVILTAILALVIVPWQDFV